MHTSTNTAMHPANPNAAVSNVHFALSANHGGLLVRPTASHREVHACSELVRRMYAWRGYRVDPPHPHLSRNQITLAAWQDGELAATITLLRDNGNNLLSETLYPLEIAELRRNTRVICEYSRLAIDPAFSSNQLMDVFFHAAYDLAHSHFRASDAVVEINPRHRRFYERELAFSLLGSLRVCPRVDAPAILMHRDMTQPYKARPTASKAHLLLPNLPLARHPLVP